MSYYSAIDTKKSNKWVSLIYFMLSNLVVALAFYFLTSEFIYKFSVNSEPSFSLNPSALLWITFSMLVILGVVNFMLLSLSKNQNKAGMRLSFTLYYIFMLGVLLWAFFSFTLALPTAGVVLLGITICLGIYLTYRYLTRSIVAGVILTIFNLYLIYLFVTNFAYILVR